VRWLLRLRPPLTGSLPKPDSQAKPSGCCGLTCLNKDCPPPQAGCPLGDPGVSWKREKISRKKSAIGFLPPCLLLPGCFRGQKDRKRHCQSDKFRRILNCAIWPVGGR